VVIRREDVVSEVNKVIHEGFEVPMDKLVPSAQLFGELELDSLDAIDLMVALEERTGLKVNIEVFKNARSLEDVYKMVTDLVDGKESQSGDRKTAASAEK
jgi:acyl carrier protein